MPEFRDPVYGLKIVTNTTYNPDTYVVLATPVGTRDEAISISGLGTILTGTSSSHSCMIQTAHGFTESNAGYVITGHTLFDDTSDQWPTGVITSYIDANTFTYACYGQTLTIPAARVNTGYSIATDGRFLYWDYSLTKYVATKPSDSSPDLPPILMVNFYNATTATYNCSFILTAPLGA